MTLSMHLSCSVMTQSLMPKSQIEDCKVFSKKKNLVSSSGVQKKYTQTLPGLGVIGVLSLNRYISSSFNRAFFIYQVIRY